MTEPPGTADGMSNLDRASVRSGIQDARAVYPLGSSTDASTRLQRQADELEPDSVTLLDRVNLRSGDNAADMGCGPRGVLDLLHERVSPGGRVIGIDADPVHVAMAREFVNQERMTGIDLLCADARNTGLMGDYFDVAHARMLLTNVRDASAVLAEMVRIVRPGGLGSRTRA